MPYVLQGTKDLISYWNTLGRPCERGDLAEAVKAPRQPFIGAGRDKKSLTVAYGEKEAQTLAAKLGVTVSDVTDNAGQILI